MVIKVGLIGYGHLGQYLASKIIQDENFELIFVWNRTISTLRGKIDESLILNNLDDFVLKNVDLIVEVAHPSITRSHGKVILKHCNYMIGSPTALCDENLLQDLKSAATKNGLYVPSGAFWGGEDLKKMSEAGLIRSLIVTMKKHPKSLKLEGHLKEKNAMVTSGPTLLYEGCVRDVCALAPNNTNTMAAAALAVPSLGFGNVIGRLISDPELINYHIVEIEAFGYPKEEGSCFHVHTIRKNPAVIGEVTGEATYAAYFGSLKRAAGKGPGLHLC
ncbi:aspartate dehydrogenase domain-containing protein-like isoform X2 [Parasteatoda tepidariorum]|uniref:aspartate dehydrogenase domain-containing protein-like isoform X2 n=1 Tax=Parasteatoda tepidariorum TaxID=114398 RepID=UPI00077FC6F5